MTTDERLERVAEALWHDDNLPEVIGWGDCTEKRYYRSKARTAILAWQQDAPEVKIANCKEHGGSPRCTLYRNQYGYGECILELGWSKDQSRDSNPYCMNIGSRCPGEGTYVLTPKLQQKGGG